MDRMGLRLALRQAQADAGDIALLYADESEALTHPYLAHAWAEQGADLRVQAPGQSRKGKREPMPTVDGAGLAVQAALAARASLQFQGRSSLSLVARCPRASWPMAWAR